MSNKPNHSKHRSHRARDREQAEDLLIGHLVAEAAGCTCGPKRIMKTVELHHVVIKWHEDECPLRKISARWIVHKPRRPGGMP